MSGASEDHYRSHYRAEPGEILASRYTIIMKMGEGVFSRVWLAWDCENSIFVALKIYRSGAKNTAVALHEIYILQILDIQNSCGSNSERIIGFKDTFTISNVNGEFQCIVIEALGSSTQILLRNSHNRGLNMNIVKSIIRQLLEALDFLHTKCGIIHSDIKPDNVLLRIQESQIMDMASEAIESYLRKSKSLNLFYDDGKTTEFKNNPRFITLDSLNKQIQAIKEEKMVEESETVSATSNQKQAKFEKDPFHCQKENGSKIKTKATAGQDPVSCEKLFTDQTFNKTGMMKSNENKTDSYEKTDSKFRLDSLNLKLEFKIVDFSNAHQIDKECHAIIQAQYYRALEVIIGAGYNTSADIWSVACMAFELATGNNLFRISYGCNDVNKDHLVRIVSLLGQIPEEIINSGSKSQLFFDNEGKLKNSSKLEHHSIVYLLTKNYNWPKQKAEDFSAFLEPMLQLNPKCRASASECLRHPWLKD